MNGHQLRRIRHSLGVNQSDFGEMLGGTHRPMDQANVSRLERGAVEISYRVAMTALAVLAREGQTPTWEWADEGESTWQ